MLSPDDKMLGKLDPFYRPSVSKRKTSAEIISEARNALRTVRTQRPFTPQEAQRKLFGPASSRTSENRPPSSFSLHASSFESSDSRPISGTRLSPLELKPKVPASPTREEDSCFSFPKPPVDSAKIRRISSARARLFRAASQGALLPDRSLPPSDSKKTVESKETVMMGDSVVKINGIYLTKSNAICHLKSHPLQLTYDGGFGEIKEQEMFKGTTSLPSHLKRGGDQGKRHARASSRPSSSDLSRLQTKAVPKADLQEKDAEIEVDEVFWNTRIVPILRELEKESLLEVLRSEDLQTNMEAFLYCMGSIKFISGNPGFLNEMISKDAVEILINLINQINENTEKCGTCLPNSGHLLVQVTATLRNLVDSPLVRTKFLSISALPQLCTAMEQYMGDKDVCTNIARIFSKLTSYRDCCAALASYSRCYALFLNLINKYQKKQDLVVRVVFILGNLTAKNNQAREQFSKEKGSIQTLLSLFQTFHQLDLHSQKPVGQRGEQHRAQRPPSEAEDVLIKLTRVLANIAIHPGVGPVLAANPGIVGLLLTTLEYKSLDDCEELVINATATINNLSYYQVKNSIIQDKKLYIAELLLKLLVSNNMDGILEAVRVFGNLSQDRDVCDFIVQNNVHRFMMALLDAQHQDICFSACGVLLNLTVDKDKRVILKEGGGIKKLVDCLRDFGPTDWQLACLVCKTLWNFSENTNASSCFGNEDTNTLLLLLSSFLDEELALDGSFDPDLKNYHKFHWETEFKPVAQQLLNRIQRHHTFLEPLPIPSF
ncbi:armadillo repeat-containing protein 2 isoform X1 [Rhinopithecus roxellana]|uniref:armadillo repeat-containing protein 2 isoform X1 n=1 Tax=Rhinopithecus roxellana TaxID=61622 RepID=UPI0012376981|nr:armadillo repeat-containing protein 2 isoform X1 [Rhinopithecus roxellana]XP_030784046.1 armadillo repeat-containing protein 2 isoform X1 [Rhinopithecus roxellana]